MPAGRPSHGLSITPELRLLDLARQNSSEDERRAWDLSEARRALGRVGGKTSGGWNKQPKTVKLQQAARDTMIHAGLMSACLSSARAPDILTFLALKLAVILGWQEVPCR